MSNEDIALIVLAFAWVMLFAFGLRLLYLAKRYHDNMRKLEAEAKALATGIKELSRLQENLIRAYCPERQSFADFIREYRGDQ